MRISILCQLCLLCFISKVRFAAEWIGKQAHGCLDRHSVRFLFDLQIQSSGKIPKTTELLEGDIQRHATCAFAHFISCVLSLHLSIRYSRWVSPKWMWSPSAELRLRRMYFFRLEACPVKSSCIIPSPSQHYVDIQTLIGFAQDTISNPKLCEWQQDQVDLGQHCNRKLSNMMEDLHDTLGSAWPLMKAGSEFTILYTSFLHCDRLRSVWLLLRCLSCYIGNK